VNNAGAAVEITSASSDLSLAGLLRLTDGAINIGDDLTGVDENSILYTTGAATITVEGGTLTVGGAIRPNPDVATMNYTQSGGLVQVSNNTSTGEFNNGTGNTNRSIADFSISTASGSSFAMSAGELEVIRRNNTVDGKGFWIVEGISHNVTGGTVRIVTAETGGNADRDIGISSGAPIWNLEIGEASATYPGTVGGNITEYTLQILNDFTLNIDDLFKLHRANNASPSGNDEFDLHVGGNLTVERGTFGFPRPEDSEGVVLFNGTAAQSIIDNDDGEIAFFSFELAKASGTLQFATGTNISVEKDFTYTSGTLDQNGQLVTFNGTVNQSISGNAFAFDDITINNPAGITQSLSPLTINGTLNLDAGVFSIDANQLIFEETASVSTSGTFGTSTMIQTNGLGSGLGVQKAYSTAGGSFTFPIGTDVYSPATINVTNADGVAGTVTVNPVNSRDATAPTTTSLDYQWIVESTGFGAGLAVSHSYIYDDTEVAGTEGNYLDAYFDGISWTEGNTANVDASTNTIGLNTSGSISEFQFTAGESPFTNPTVYYSRTTGDWSVSGTWSTDPSGTPTAVSPPAASNPVVIQDGNVVTVPATTAVNAASTTIESTGILDIQETDGSQYDIGTIGGTGTLRFTVGDTPDVPTLDNDFVAAGGGTVEYAYSANNALPTSQLTYNNLILSGTNRYNLDSDYTINGDLTITTTDRLDDDGFTLLGTVSGTFVLDGAAEYRVEGPSSFPSGFGTYDMQSGSLVRYITGNDQIVSSLNGDDYWDIAFNGTSTKTLAGNIIVTDDLTISSGSVLSASAFNINLQGDWNRDSRNSSAFLPGTGTVIFNGMAAQEIDITNTSSAETFGNVEINNSAGVSVDDGGAEVTQLNITGNLRFTDGTLDMQSWPLTVSGNMINNSGSTTPITGASDVIFNSTSADQEINGTNGIDFENLTLAKATGITLTLNVPVSISGTLDMQNDGNIVLSGTTNDLSFGSAASLSGTFSSSRMIVTDGSNTSSQLIKEGDGTGNTYDFTFPVGVGGNYTPISIDATSVNTAGGSIGVRTVDGVGSYIVVDGTRTIDRHFTLSLNSITDITGSLSFTYADADVQGSEINYLSWVYDGATLDEAANEFVTPGTNTFGSTNITISDATTEWTAGEAGAFFAKLYSTGSGSWTDAIWNTAADGTGTATTPTQFNEVEIQSGDIVTSSSDVLVAALQLDGNLELTNTATGYDFGSLTGTGQLTLNDGNLPGFNVLGTTFFDNGTVEFTDGGGEPGYDLPSSILSYNNLIISGNQNKRLAANLTVANDLTIDNATLDADLTGNYNVSLGGNLSLVGSGTLDPRDGTFALIGSSAQSVPTGIAFNNLQFDNVGTKSITSAGTFSANDFRILSASGTVGFSVGTDVEITGSWANGSSIGAAVYSNVQDLTLDGNSDQSISGINSFHNLNINKTGGSSRTVTVSGSVTLDDGANGGNMTISAGDAVSGTANYNLLGDWTNSGTFETSSTVNFNGTLAQDMTGENSFGSLIIDNASGVTIADDVTTTIASDLTVTSGTLNTGGGTATLVFDGAGEQSINGAVTFNNLTKQAGDTLRLSGSSTVNGTLTLTQGIINTTSSDLLIIGPAGDIPSGSVSSYVNGPMQHTENSTAADTKLFPFGNDGVYRPITLNLRQADATIRTYTGSITEGAPPSRTLPTGADSLTRVSAFRYYTITQSPAAAVTAASVVIDYNVDDRSDDGSTLRVAKSDGAGNWVNIGGIGSNPLTESVFSAGTITSGNFTTFSDFVLASSSEPLNPLPVELIRFGADVSDQKIQLQWTTAQEKDNDYFVVERSADAQQFDKIGRVKGTGDSNIEVDYQFIDDRPLPGVAYYRLKQIDYDGSFSYSRIVSVTFTLENNIFAGVTPNPVENGKTVLNLSGVEAYTKVVVMLVDTEGKLIRKINAETNSYGTLNQTIVDLDPLASGVYTLLVNAEGFSKTLRLVIP